MSTEEVTALTPRMAEVSPEYREILMLGNVLYQSGYFKDIKDQAQAVTKILFGKELGFSPIVSISGIHIIEGKPALSSNLMATLIKRSGKYDYRVKTWDLNECVLTFRERVSGVSGSFKWDDVGESSFSMADAKTAGVAGKGAWAKFPKAMMFARALSQGMRVYCPDVSASPLYVPEEMGAEVNQDGDVVQLPKSARPVERTTEAIPISAPANKRQAVQEGTLVAQGADQHSTAVVATPPLRAGGSADAEIPTVTEAAAVESPLIDALIQKAEEIGVIGADCIDAGMAANLHRLFRDTLPVKLRKQSEEMLHDYLRTQKIVDVLGKPSALAIKKENFYVVREQAVQFAGTFKL